MKVSAPRADAFFLPRPNGQRFALYNPPAGDRARAAVVHVPAFAEEMNKARRMSALQARSLADAGCAVLRIDLLGCGDSSGDFEEASWPAWRDDVAAGAAWLGDRHPGAPLWMWGLRAGCLLAAETAATLDAPVGCVFWQPITSGLIALRQFLRLRMAAALEGERGAVQQARQALARGEAVEIAGYRLSPELAIGLEQSRLVPPSRAARIAWFEVSSRADPALPPASLDRVAAWRAADWTVDDRFVEGPPFWQTSEIATAPALIEATTAAVLAPEVAT